MQQFQDKKGRILERVEQIGRYVVENHCTVREAAVKFGVSKTTCHNDLRKRLPQCDLPLAKEVEKVINTNKAEWHIRGGKATKRKKESFK